MVVVVLKALASGIIEEARIADDTQGVGLRTHQEEQDRWLAGNHADLSPWQRIRKCL